MTRLGVAPRSVPGWVQGLVEDAEPGTLAPGTIEAGKNFVPTPAGRMRTRGGSRVMLTLNNDNGTPAEIDRVLAIAPFTGIGAIVIGWDLGELDHYAWLVTSDMAFAITDEANSRFAMATALPSWSGATYATLPGRPNMAEVWEKMFVADATTDITKRSELISIDAAGTMVARAFDFSGSANLVPRPYCIEEYNGVLFMAGYGTETSGDLDRPEYLRHSFLGKSPDAADGFDADAWNLIGSKGQRITALRKGRGMLLVAKEDEFYRVSGFGKAFAGWQYQVEQVSDTQGLGITNPKALTFAEGFWWGVSSSGPIRSDGFSVDLLVGPRKPSWRGTDALVESWVVHHPERRLMLFGLHPAETETGRSDTFPWRVWAWDMVRSVWQPDHEFGIDLTHASAITTTSAEGPSAAPSSPSTTAETTVGYTATVTLGDSSAATEFWEKDPDTGTWALFVVVAAATTNTGALTGRINHKSYYWRSRHTKNGIPSAWDVEAGTLAQTLIAAPGQVATQVANGPRVQIVLTQNAVGTDVRVEKQTDGGGYVVLNTYTSQPAGDFTVFDLETCGVVLDYRSRSDDGSWPANSTYSAVDQVDLTTGCVEE